MLSENKIIEENEAKSKENADRFEKKFTELSAKYQQILKDIQKDEFTFEKFEHLKSTKNSLIVKCQTLDRESVSARKAAEKWKKKFTSLR